VSGKAERWQEARLILTEATNHLVNANSDELQSRIDRAQSDLKLANELEHVRQKAVISVVERFVKTQAFFPELATESRAAFLRAGYDVAGKPEEIAAQILAARLSGQLLTVIDEWAFAAYMNKQRQLADRLLNIARIADPHPDWRDRLRNTDNWNDLAALYKLAEQASVSTDHPAAHQLAMLGLLLQNLGEKSAETQLLRQALRRHPGDFWLNWEMASALARDDKPGQALAYFQIVVALRPGNPWTMNHLGTCFGIIGNFEEAIIQFRLALELAPESPAISHNLVISLFRAGHPQEAETEARRAISAYPTDHYGPHILGRMLFDRNRPEEAIPFFLLAIQRDPKAGGSNCNLGHALAATRRHDQAIAAFRKAFEIDPSQMGAHYGLGLSLLKLERHQEAVQEFEWLIQKLDPEKTGADKTVPDKNQLAKNDPAKNDPAKNETDATLAKTFAQEYSDARVSLPAALLGLGQFKKAVSATRSALELPKIKDLQRTSLRRQLEIGHQLAPFETQLRGAVEEQSATLNTGALCALAEWAAVNKNRPVAAVRIYEHVFSKDPALVANPETRHRLNAALAAATAAGGSGNDAKSLSLQEQIALRNVALKWMQADLDAWKKRFQVGLYAEQLQATQAIREWQQCEGLEIFRESALLKKLPADEQAAWEKFWTDANLFASQDPAVSLNLARAAVDRKQWVKAAELYTKILQNTKEIDGEARFELAAVQLLSGDRPNYQRTCQQMYDLAKTPTRCRPYLAARAATLAPDSGADFILTAQLAAAELQQSEKSFWSLCERGALNYRMSNYAEAASRFERSLLAEPKPGAAVVNWLWLAMSCHQQGDAMEAQRWLTKAETWLSSFPEETPQNALVLGLHRHNWLESHILLKEARRLIRPEMQNARDVQP
jgi:tetratricopeptide (TPR) repeat protein